MKKKKSLVCSCCQSTTRLFTLAQSGLQWTGQGKWLPPSHNSYVYAWIQGLVHMLEPAREKGWKVLSKRSQLVIKPTHGLSSWQWTVKTSGLLHQIVNFVCNISERGSLQHKHCSCVRCCAEIINRGFSHTAASPTYPIISTNGLCESCSHINSSCQLSGICPCQPKIIKINQEGSGILLFCSFYFLVLPAIKRKHWVFSVVPWEIAQTLFCLSHNQWNVKHNSILM